MDIWTISGIVAIVTLAAQVAFRIFDGGWGMAGRLSSIETAISRMQNEVENLNNVLIKIAEMRGEHKGLDSRVSGVERDIRELRHGRGFIQGSRGIDREYPTE